MAERQRDAEREQQVVGVAEVLNETGAHEVGDGMAYPRVQRERFRIAFVLKLSNAASGRQESGRRIDQDAESGWGLHLVRELADEWGVELGAQNCVWFEVARTPLASGAHAVVHH